MVYHQPPAVSPLMVFMSDATRTWPVRIGLIVLFLALVAMPRFRAAALAAAVGALLSNTTTDLLKKIWPVDRPTALGYLPFAEGGYGPGTASAHAANMAAVAVCLWMADRRLGIAWAVIALLTGVSRVYVGVHYPSQVVLGWSIGIGYGLLLIAAVRAWWPKASTPQPEPTDPTPPECQSADPQP